MQREVPPLEMVIVGHVDHGKSTLIGRLFYDTGSLPQEKYEAIRYACEVEGREFEFAFLMDALAEEREQNVTIDTAQTYFQTAVRRYVIIDAPGHKEFLKNMLTGAAQADAALLLVDAAEGVREQTRRHAYVLSLLGIQQVIVAINKMDLVGWSQTVYDDVRRTLLQFLHGLGITPLHVVPISARAGDNIAATSEQAPWYDGPTILAALDTCSEVRSPAHLPLRFPLQDVYRWDDQRYYAGRVEAGLVRVGDDVILRPSDRRVKVRSIEVWGDPGRREAVAGESVALTFDEELFAERGEVVAIASRPPRVANEVVASLFWLGLQPLSVGQKVILKLATAECEATVLGIDERLDSSSLEILERHAAALLPTESGTVVLGFRRPLALDLYEENARLGRFVVVVDGIVRGGGTVREARAEVGIGAAQVVRLDDRWIDEPDGSYVDLTREAPTFEADASAGLLQRILRGERLLVRLRSPQQMTSLTRLAYEQGYDYHFHRTADGRIDLLLCHPSPHVPRRNEADFAI
ncbi:MAG: GTP-binding protein [Fimbriimonadaceae bacterium]|nr:GTP-binding protein [Fimbriimonadaceae bacterium]